jgi:hypothetical protein
MRNQQELPESWTPVARRARMQTAALSLMHAQSPMAPTAERHGVNENDGGLTLIQKRAQRMATKTQTVHDALRHSPSQSMADFEPVATALGRRPAEKQTPTQPRRHNDFGVHPPGDVNLSRTRRSQKECGRESPHISENSLQDTTLSPVGVQRPVGQQFALRGRRGGSSLGACGEFCLRLGWWF